jgi:hypothetical protein
LTRDEDNSTKVGGRKAANAYMRHSIRTPCYRVAGGLKLTDVICSPITDVCHASLGSLVLLVRDDLKHLGAIWWKIASLGQ